MGRENAGRRFLLFSKSLLSSRCLFCFFLHCTFPGTITIMYFFWDLQNTFHVFVQACETSAAVPSSVAYSAPDYAS